MRFVSSLLKHVVYPLLSSGGYFRWVAGRGGLSVITYHGVLPEGYRPSDSFLDGNLVSAESFRQQLRWLKTNYQVVSPDDVLEWLERGGELAPRSVLLTCDDGSLNTLTDMVPILREEGLPCLFFVTGMSAGEVPRMLWYEELYVVLMSARSGPVSFETLGIQTGLRSLPQRRSLWWKLVQELSRHEPEERDSFVREARIRHKVADVGQDAKTSDDCRRRRFFLLTRTELKQLAANGMCIGAHTMSHPVLSQQSAESALKEMQESRSTLENTLGKRVWAFAYPFGDAFSITSRDIQLAERAGYRCAFVNFGGGFGARLPHFAIPRVHISAEMGPAEFDAHVSGFYQSLRGQVKTEQHLFMAGS
jgi:peptidoglycan/xylan/chitin deacetylase (PgdA/CDA1 family)